LPFKVEPIKKTYKEKEEPIKKTYKEVKRKRPEIIKKWILELCKTPRSANELANELKLNRVYLVINYLKKMVREGKLRRTNPAPRARNQKYYTVESEKENVE